MAESVVPVQVALWLGVALLLFNAFFVGAEFALISVRRTKIEPLAREGSGRARTTLRAMGEVSLMMAGAQLGITVCTVLLGAIAEPGLATLLGPLVAMTGLPAEATGVISFVIAISIVVLLHVVLGEMVPKNIALAAPERSSLTLGPPLMFVVTVLRPLIWVLNQIANLSLRAMGVTPRDEVASAYTPEEVRGIVEESREEGMLKNQSYELLSGALSFSDRTIEPVLLPLAELAWVTPESSVADLEDLTARTGYSRFPVFAEHDEAAPEVRGYVHIKDTLGEPRDTVINNKWTRPMPIVRLDTPLRGAMQMMQARRAHMAAVLGEDDETLGVIALEDVLEELVGQVRDATRADDRSAS
ncbi:CBS domain containing-hemolysin-like protein [Naumannella cuiyingiana]|uniref:CBS domain containing-hemolysin-like protein n=1 Tax=Naumannella cuiyingiana TaxID=1347891 RepID=A0A7Z0D8A4_9ACTN|nr:hemolysin family protein [Naumannella cuiyingiana]NYI70784.1 CBS domain containing-hemolysin-like protein [Naumannella cuiyingiana]